MYNNTFQKSWLWVNQRLIKKNNKLPETQNFNIESKMFHQTILFHSKLYILTANLSFWDVLLLA